MADEVKRLKNILEEKKSNTQNIFYLDDIFETVKNNLRQLYELIQKYRQLLYPSLFEGIKHLSEDEEKEQLDLIHDMRNCIKLIGKAIGEATRIQNSKGKIILKDIDEANSNLMTIAGTSDYLKKVYNKLTKDNKNLIDHLHLLLAAEKSLDDIIQKYNDSHKEKLYSLGNALYQFNSDTPKA